MVCVVLALFLVCCMPFHVFCCIHFLTGLSLIIGELLEQITQNATHVTSVTEAMVLALVVAGLFEPAKRLVQRRMDRLFFRDPEIRRRLAGLERVSSFVVAKDLGALSRLKEDWAWIIAQVKGQSPDRGSNGGEGCG